MEFSREIEDGVETVVSDPVADFAAQEVKRLERRYYFLRFLANWKWRAFSSFVRLGSDCVTSFVTCTFSPAPGREFHSRSRMRFSGAGMGKIVYPKVKFKRL